MFKIVLHCNLIVTGGTFFSEHCSVHITNCQSKKSSLSHRGELSVVHLQSNPNIKGIFYCAQDFLLGKDAKYCSIRNYLSWQKSAKYVLERIRSQTCSDQRLTSISNVYLLSGRLPQAGLALKWPDSRCPTPNCQAVLRGGMVGLRHFRQHLTFSPLMSPGLFVHWFFNWWWWGTESGIFF